MENVNEGVSDNKAAALRRQRDFDDLQNEVAGRETGRAVRFLPEGARGQDTAARRRAEQAETLTRLQLMMRDPVYAALHDAATKGLRQVQSDLDRMRDDAQRLLDEDTEALVLIDARAAKDTEGLAVFRDRSGAVRYADGDRVSDAEAAGILWRGDKPRFEEREFHAERRARVESILADIDAGQAEVGEMQNRLEDDHDPATADEVKAMPERAAEISTGLQARIDAEGALKPTVTPVLEVSAQVAQIAVPSL